MKATKSDKLWLDEHAKRSLVRNIYSVAHLSFAWGLFSRVSKMLVDKSCGKKIPYQPKKTPALLAGLTLLGLGMDYLLSDQFGTLRKLQAQRQAKRIGLNKDTLPEYEKLYAKAPEKVRWRDVWSVGGLTQVSKYQNLSPDELQFERRWLQKYIRLALIGDGFGTIPYGALYGLLPFVLEQLLAKGNGDKEGLVYRHPQTTAVLGALVAAGFASQYKQAKINTKLVIHLNNYEAYEIARIKETGQGNDANKSALAMGETEKSSDPFYAYDKKWEAENSRIRVISYATHTLSSTLFYGAIGTAANMVLKKAAGKPVPFKRVQGTSILASSMLVGGICSYLASLAGAHVLKQEDDRLVMRIFGREPDKDGSPQKAAGERREGLYDGIEPPKDFKAYDKEWLKHYQQLSFGRGLYDSLATSTFFGLFSILTGAAIDKVGNPGKDVDFRMPQSAWVMAAMGSLGAGFAYLCNAKEAQISKLEDDRLAYRFKASERLKPEKGEPQLKPQLPAHSVSHTDDMWRARIVQQRSADSASCAVILRA